MADEPRRIYWDACVVLSYFNDVTERVPVLEELLKQARADEIELLTSSISRVEVSFIQSEKDEGRLDEDAEKAIEAFWSPGSPVKTVEFYDLVAEDARALIRRGIDQGWGNLKPMDAIHVATAQRMQVSEMHSYDDRIKKWSGHLGFPITDAQTAQGVLGAESSLAAEDEKPA